MRNARRDGSHARWRTVTAVAEGLRWAVIGTGKISDSFAADIRAAGGTITRVWGRHPGRLAAFARRHETAGTTDLAAVLAADDVDIAYIATPAATHATLAVQLLSAGKHVLVEKPMAMSDAEAAEVFDCATAHGRFAMEGMWMKFNPLHREVMRRALSGEFGELSHVRGGFGAPFPPGGSRWSAELGGSVILNQAIYTTTLATWALGQVTGVEATGQVRDGVDVSAALTLRHASGVSQAAVSALAFVDPTAAVSGSRGWATVEGMFWAGHRARIHSGDVPALFERPEELVLPLEGHGYTPMIRSVHEAVRSGQLQHPDHDAAATLSVLAVLAEARRQIFDAVGQRS